MSDTLVYKFGLPFGPVENEQMVYDQMMAAHRYRNLLIYAENERRAESREAERDFDLPRFELDFQQAKKELEDARDAVKLARAKASRPAKKGAKAKATRQVPKVLTDRVAAAKEAKKAAQQAWHECRQRIAQNAAVTARRDLINEKFGETTRKLRSESAKQNDLFWGTYLLVERAFKAACATPLYRKGEPNDLKRVFWDGEGQVGLQIQAARNFDLAKIFERNTMVWISPVDERAWHSTSRSEQREYARTTLHLRIGSDDKRKPIWAHFPMIMHRPFPRNARLTWVSVNRIRIGPRWQWSVDFTLDTSLSPKLKACGTGTVAINLGWRGSCRTAFAWRRPSTTRAKWITFSWAKSFSVRSRSATSCAAVATWSSTKPRSRSPSGYESETRPMVFPVGWLEVCTIRLASASPSRNGEASRGLRRFAAGGRTIGSSRIPRGIRRSRLGSSKSTKRLGAADAERTSPSLQCPRDSVATRRSKPGVTTTGICGSGRRAPARRRFVAESTCFATLRLGSRPSTRRSYCTRWT